jgi:endonuclease/exonuclease/phosphatase family metal-dependent hydrolase
MLILGRTVVLALIFFCFFRAFADKNDPATSFDVVAYNVQNLFDTDGISLYDDYKPDFYGETELSNKLKVICQVLRKIGGESGPDVILFQEIEVDRTPTNHPSAANSLINALRKEQMPYEYYELGYDPKDSSDKWPAVHCLTLSKFPIVKSRLHPIQMARPILETTIQVNGNSVTLFNNHWKSGASSPEMELHRLQNARTLRTRIDELRLENPQADFLVGGDLNSHYNQATVYEAAMEQTGINHILGSVGRKPTNNTGNLYNLWHELEPGQRGSDTWRGNWGTLMHLLIPPSLSDGRGINYLGGSFNVAKFPGLNAVMGSEVPLAWSNDLDGFGASDHFPIVARFTTGSARTGTGKTFEQVEGRLRKVGYDSAKKKALDWKPSSLKPSSYGQVFRFEGIISRNKPLTLLAEGHQVGLYSFDSKTREVLFSLAKERHISGYGRLSRYRGQWQFIVENEDWFKEF